MTEQKKPLFIRIIFEEKELWHDLVRAIHKARENEKIKNNNSQVLRDLDAALELPKNFWEDTQEMVNKTLQECEELQNGYKSRRSNERPSSSLSQNSVSSIQSKDSLLNENQVESQNNAATSIASNGFKLRRPHERPSSSLSQNSASSIQSKDSLLYENQIESQNNTATSIASQNGGGNERNLTSLQLKRDILFQYRREKRAETIPQSQPLITQTTQPLEPVTKTSSIQDRLRKVRSETNNQNDQERLNNTLQKLLIADKTFQNSNKNVKSETNNSRRDNNKNDSRKPIARGPRPTRCWNCDELNHNFTQCSKPFKEFCHYCGKKNVKTKECICSQKK